jgi:hypothetical protein
LKDTASVEKASCIRDTLEDELPMEKIRNPDRCIDQEYNMEIEKEYESR